MIRLSFDNRGNITLGQEMTKPSVYMDHWALRHFSDSANREMRRKFVQLIHAKSGTLCISWVGVAEFAKVTIAQERTRAEQLVESILPRVFFIESNPFEVHQNELEFRAQRIHFAPQADQQHLKAFFTLSRNGLKPFTAVNLFSELFEAGVTDTLDLLAKEVVARVNELRSQTESNPTFKTALSRQPRSAEKFAGTIEIFRELSSRLIIDRRMNMNRNHAIDLLHAVVPSAYCDFVLLDGHWSAQVEKMRGRFSNAGLKVPIARAFSRRGKGIEQFLNELDKWTGI